MQVRPEASSRYDVEIHYHVQLPMRDGTLLSANLWLPIPSQLNPHQLDPHQLDPSQPGERFPVILEMIPYRKDDWRFITDHQRMNYLAQRGFACCRLDVRGTGSSQGVALDEYTVAETEDGYDAVEWLAVQAWCNGNVGMWGISYGGFTAIQVAMLQPPHLRAIVPMYATDDRYTDDVHFIGGCMVVSEFAQYAASQIGMNALPPNPQHVGDDWQQVWRDRLEATPPWVLSWLRNQTDGPYWRQGSLAPDYANITCAIYHIAGWHDGYVDCALRMHEKCVNAPRKTLIGPWVHSLPDSTYPGPNLDWLHEMVRFFDYWLKGIDTGVADEANLVVFLREYTAPGAFVERLKGEWIGINEIGDWRLEIDGDQSTSNLQPPISTLYLTQTQLSSTPPTHPFTHRYPHQPTWGTHGPLCWGGGAGPNGLARDLRPDEATALTFTSDPIAQSRNLLGFPELVLYLQSSTPVAHVVVWLSDVAPDGSSALVSKGVLNLTHRHGHTTPQPIDPDEVMEVRVQLRAAGYRFLPGQRIRVTIASALWPVIWPSPFRGENMLHCAPNRPSRLILPLLPDTAIITPPTFKTTLPDLLELGSYRSDALIWQITEDVLAGSVTVLTYEGDEQTLPNGDTIFTSERLTMTAHHDIAADVRFASDVVYRLVTGGHEVAITANMLITSTEQAFDVRIDLDVMLDGKRFFQRSWEEIVKRQLC